MTRTDAHRPSTIIPADYQYLCSYARATTQDGWPVPALNIDLVIVHQGEAFQAGHAMFGAIGKCGVCGAVYSYGDLWRHVPTGQIVHLGHDCADKYELIADRQDYERDLGAARTRSAREHERAIKAERAADQLAQLELAHPGLREALTAQHPIIADIAVRLARWGNISDKQAALVLKLAAEIANPAQAETMATAPTGKVTFEGQIVSIKDKNSFWGGVAMTVKVVTPDGSVWCAWGTAPTSLFDAVHASTTNLAERNQSVRDAMRGRRVEVSATLKPGRDAHFAIMSRPRARFV